MEVRLVMGNFRLFGGYKIRQLQFKYQHIRNKINFNQSGNS